FLLTDQANRPDEGLALAQRARQLDPENPDVADTIGWAFYRKGLYRSALDQLTVAAAGGGSPQVKYHLAMAYLKVGDQQKGRQVLQEALQLNPNLPEAEMARGVMRESSKVR